MHLLFRPHNLAAAFVFIAIAGGYLLMALQYPVAYIWSTYEDLHGEWMQTWLFAVACILFIGLSTKQSRYRWFFMLLVAATFYTVGEEISWGQRVFGVESSEFFKRYNLQHETNIHNLLVGPVSSNIKDYIEYGLATALLLYGVAFPVLLRLRFGLACWFDRLGVASPPLAAMPFFATAAWLELAPYKFNEAEVAELLVGAALVFLAVHHRVKLSKSGSSKRAGVQLILFVLLAGVLAGASAYSVYQDDQWRGSINARLLNGYEKFAKRYSRYDRWDIAAQLYRRVHQAEPERTSLMRRLARAYRGMGDESRFQRYSKKALNTGLKRFVKNPDKVSTNLSIAYSYRQLGMHDRYKDHADRAHRIALESVKTNPDSAKSAYWLGKTYRLKKENIEALVQYRRAFELKPSSKKYRRAYFSLKKSYGK